MNNKVFVKLVVPEIDRIFDLYLPINKKIGNISNLLIKAISDITNGEIEVSNQYYLYNIDTCEKYGSDILLYNTDIRNGSKLLFIK